VRGPIVVVLVALLMPISEYDPDVTSSKPDPTEACMEEAAEADGACDTDGCSDGMPGKPDPTETCIEEVAEADSTCDTDDCSDVGSAIKEEEPAMSDIVSLCVLVVLWMYHAIDRAQEYGWILIWRDS